MGRKRKLADPINVASAHEVKAFNVSSEAKSDVEKLHFDTKNSKDMEALNAKNSISINGKPDKSSGETTLVVRRSPRISSLSSPAENLRALEPVNLVEDEKEQEPDVHHDSIPPIVNGRTLEEKIDYIVEAADYFKSKVFGREGELPCSKISYKSMYLNSQKKIEALMEENYELVRKLEFARGKIAAYEMMKDAAGAQKEFVLVPALEKAANATVNLSTPQDNGPHGVGNPKPMKIYKKQVKKR